MEEIKEEEEEEDEEERKNLEYVSFPIEAGLAPVSCAGAQTWLSVHMLRCVYSLSLFFF